MEEPRRPPRLPGPLFTYMLLAVVLALFAWMETHGGTRDGAVLERWGALDPVNVIVHRQYWRLLTAIFLHQGIIHVGLNSLVLYQMGRLVEALFGHARFLIIFLLSGVAGTAASLLLGPSLVSSVGASGAIFGLFGAMVIWRLMDPRARQVPWRELLGPIVINLSVGLAIPHVDQWAHLGGLAGGVAAGALAGLPGRDGRGWHALGLTAACLAAAALVLGRVPIGQTGPRAELVRGFAALLDDQAAAAEPHLRAAVAGRPQDANGHALLAYVLMERGQPQAAVASARRALILDPDNVWARQFLAQVGR